MRQLAKFLETILPFQLLLFSISLIITGGIFIFFFKIILDCNHKFVKFISNFFHFCMGILPTFPNFSQNTFGFNFDFIHFRTGFLFSTGLS